MHLGLFAVGTGNHIAGWRHPGASKSASDIEVFLEMAKTAERAKFDMFFLADGVKCSPDYHPGFLNQLEPMTALSAISMVTSHIGLVATASTTYSEPYNLARTFASLDLISGGRAGWNMVTTSDPDSGQNFGRAEIEHDLRYEIAAEFVEVTRGLWDSWESDAIEANVESGRYAIPEKVHFLDHDGKHFQVRGPLNAARCPQGYPVLIQAGSSKTGQEFAAKYAEVMFTVQQDLEVAASFYAEVKQRVHEQGRDPQHCKILPGLLPVVGRTEREAQEKLAELASYVDEESAMETMSFRLGHDMSQYPLDGPVPKLPISGNVQGYRRMVLTDAYRKNYTLRDLYNLFAVSRGYLIVCGTPSQVVDVMEEWFKAPACDGFNLTPAHFPESLDDFAELVVPELQRRGLFRTEYNGRTLREHFGLPVPTNRYSESGDG